VFSLSDWIAFLSLSLSLSLSPSPPPLSLSLSLCGRIRYFGGPYPCRIPLPPRSVRVTRVLRSSITRRLAPFDLVFDRADSTDARRGIRDIFDGRDNGRDFSLPGSSYLGTPTCLATPTPLNRASISRNALSLSLSLSLSYLPLSGLC
jgi:hypothetical protein